MKFARYLEDTQIPEWKKKYIDFKGLKKHISAIRRAKARNASEFLPPQTPSQSQTSLGLGRKVSTDSAIQRNYGSTDTSPAGPGASARRPSTANPPPMELPPPATSPTPSPAQALRTRATSITVQDPRRAMSRSRTSLGALEGVESHQGQAAPGTLRLLGTLHRRASWRLSSLVLPRTSTPVYANLNEFLATCDPLERQFFEKLDAEAEKIEDFYVSREAAARTRLIVLKDQLNELRGHRKLFHAAYPGKVRQGLLPVVGELLSHIPNWGLNDDDGAQSRFTTVRARGNADSSPVVLQTQTHAEPEDYASAKRKLKTALREFYRGLELLNDYRVLNETGFRKALKKFDKYTRNSSRELYMSERIEPLRFTSKKALEDMMKEVEQLYAEFFEGGNIKRTRDRLRATVRQTTHYSSAFRAGVFLGLAVPAIVAGIYLSYQEHVRERIPAWKALLQAYAALFVPTAFATLIALNVIGWARARINYIFIFELDLRTAIDSRQYAQIPAFLLMTLSYAFLLSFSGLGDPTAWPLIWILFVLVFMLDPIPLFLKRARWWIMRYTGGLLTSGVHRVEFADFWLGDQFCSLTYSLSSLYFIGCAASGGWEHAIPHCETTRNPHWPVMFFLSSLPSLVRLVQCVRRYADEGKYMHLVNGGKYGSSIVTYLCYYYWRYSGSNRDVHLAVWIFFATISSCYTSYWDLVMDWSVFTKTWPAHWLQREIIYRNHTWVYPVATVINVILRFAWTLYLPMRGPSTQLRAFIAACLEALRRIQWNFLRLENEHVGNADQFRATREVPLPYSFHDTQEDSDDEHPGGGAASRARAAIGRRRRMRESAVRLSGLESIHDDLEAETATHTMVHHDSRDAE